LFGSCFSFLIALFSLTLVVQLKHLEGLAIVAEVVKRSERVADSKTSLENFPALVKF
jgi:hypothetical protein